MAKVPHELPVAKDIAAAERKMSAGTMNPGTLPCSISTMKFAVPISLSRLPNVQARTRITTTLTIRFMPLT